MFLIGNGPSLNKTPLYLLKDEYTMTFNRFDLLLERINWNPTFYSMVDGIVMQDTQKEIKQMIEIVDSAFFFAFSMFDKIDTSKCIPLHKNVCLMIPFSHHFFKDYFSTRLPLAIGNGGTVAHVALQILAYLGFSEIYIIGVDMNYIIHTNTDELKDKTLGIQSKADDDPNHFDVRYFGKGRKYHQPVPETIQKMKEKFQMAKNRLDSLNIRTFNVGYDSKVECFEKKDFYQALGYDEEKIDMLFEDLVIKNGYTDLANFNNDCKFIKTVEEWADSEKLQSLPASEAIKIIKNKILTHLPLGPYKDKIYFLKR
ncbi:hypothetical protein FACS1894123_11660 [Bacteroidia bacterium]|nr:hypothetical protein FACS1894123_11660 [Bacteroidia bacterium]